MDYIASYQPYARLRATDVKLHHLKRGLTLVLHDVELPADNTTCQLVKLMDEERCRIIRFRVHRTSDHQDQLEFDSFFYVPAALALRRIHQCQWGVVAATREMADLAAQIANLPEPGLTT